MGLGSFKDSNMKLRITVPKFVIHIDGEDMPSSPDLAHAVDELAATVKEALSRTNAKLTALGQKVDDYAEKDQSEITERLNKEADKLEDLT